MPPIEHLEPTRVISIDDDRWQEINALSDGAASLCYQCGVCSAICPWSEVRGEAVSIRSLIRRAQLGLDDGLDDLWLCTSCGRCHELCPRGVDVAGVIRGLRLLAWEKRQSPAGLPSILWSLYWNNNPWSQPPSHRSSWAQKLDLPIFDPTSHEILLYVGCTASYDRRIQRVTRSLVRLLNAAGVAFGYLGEDEPCCGESALQMGYQPFFQELAGKATTKFRDAGVSHLVTVSPHCYSVFVDDYPDLTDVTVQHYTQFLAELVTQGRLQLNQQPSQIVTFHDPCYLARHHQDCGSPRKALMAIPGLDLVEMAHSGLDTLCCGGGGGRIFLESDPGERFADRRIREAQEVEADVIVTACPFCIVCLEDSLKAMKITQIKILDIAEITASAITLPI